MFHEKKRTVPSYAWDGNNFLLSRYHSNWRIVHFLMYKHTLLIDNGFGSRQRLLFRLKFRAALGRPFNNLFHTGLHQHLLSGMIRNYLLFFLIGFVILYFTTGNRCCQSFFRKVSAGFWKLNARERGSMKPFFANIEGSYFHSCTSACVSAFRSSLLPDRWNVFLFTA